MKNYLATLLHCVTHFHRMCYYRRAGSWKREYFCECSPRFKEVLEENGFTNH